jgi:hypothetical protein
MKTDVILALETLLDFCNDRWVAADTARPGPFPNADMLTGKKIAYNEVIQFVRTQLADRSAER